MGTTVMAILRAGNKLAMVHLGDSRGYLLRDGVLTQVTTDHTFVQHLVDIGRITPEEAEHHPQRSVVMRVLGDFDPEVTPDLSVREARPGDRWLLCSDGLSGFVSAETIEETHGARSTTSTRARTGWSSSRCARAAATTSPWSWRTSSSSTTSRTARVRRRTRRWSAPPR